jgi:MinD-like ATPase involved in chromosome partitioning or flagellar assembly
MKGKCISIHSFRGGTGKSLLAANLALIYAKRGLRVALLDLDFRAPSLVGVFSKALKVPVECWLNDYLDGRCSSANSLVDVSGVYGLTGQLFVGLANPNVDVIKNMGEKSRSWETSSVRKLFSLRSKIFEEMGFDFCFYDTSPGIQYTSVNATLSSDLSIVVTTVDSFDLKRTEDMIRELYDAFEKKVVVLLNKVFPEPRGSVDVAREEAMRQVELVLGRRVLGAIPCYCDVLRADRSTILSVENPNHPFVKDLEVVADELEKQLK